MTQAAILNPAPLRFALSASGAIARHLPQLGLSEIRAVAGSRNLIERRDALMELNLISWQSLWPHRLNPSATSFSSRWLRESLHSLDGKQVPALLSLTHDFARGQRGYYKARGITKQYQQRPSVKRAIDAVFDAATLIPLMELLPDGTTRRLTADNLPLDALPESLSKEIHVPSVFALTIAQVERALRKIEAAIERTDPTFPLDAARPNGHTLVDAKRSLLVCRQFAEQVGGIPALYMEFGSGRLGSSGSTLHPVTMSRSLRHLLLEDSGLFDFDIIACNWSIYLAVAESMGLSTTHSRRYVEDRVGFHSEWAQLTGHTDPSAFKSIALSWLTGGSLGESDRASAVQSIGRESVRRLAQAKSVQCLRQEVQQGISAIVSNAPQRIDEAGRTVIENALGKTVTLDGSISKYQPKAAAHLLAGWEQFAIRAMCPLVSGLKAIVFDGFIAQQQQSVDPLESAVRTMSQDLLGFKLDVRLKVQPFKAPDLAVIDETDF